MPLNLLQSLSVHFLSYFHSLFFHPSTSFIFHSLSFFFSSDSAFILAATWRGQTSYSNQEAGQNHCRWSEMGGAWWYVNGEVSLRDLMQSKHEEWRTMGLGRRRFSQLLNCEMVSYQTSYQYKGYNYYAFCGVKGIWCGSLEKATRSRSLCVDSDEEMSKKKKHCP